MELHVFNGDCAFDAWRRAGEGGREGVKELVWRESYLEGRIPDLEVPLAEFERIRAEELHRLMPEWSVEVLLRSLQTMDRTIACLTADDSVVLWFDVCMYDQVMLARILYLLKDTPAAVFLVCEDVAWGRQPELFAVKRRAASRLSAADIALFAAAWEAVAGGADALDRLSAEPRLKRFPYLAKALARYREEFPGADGLGRSERQLLGIVRSGKHTCEEIFQSFGECEEHPFMGDTMCWRMLDRLAERGLFAVTPGETGKIYRLR